MSSYRTYSHSAVVVAAIAWLLLAALFGGLLVTEHLLRLALPQWLLWFSAIAALVSLAVATVIPPETRCELTVRFPLFW